jgi:hypothetical protein
MTSISKVVGVLSCGFLLCLGLSNAAQSHNEGLGANKETGKQQINDKEAGQPHGGKTITGEVLLVEGNNCFIKGQDGKEVRLHIDVTTLKATNIEPGDRIEAKVNDQNHVLLNLSDKRVPVHQRTVGQ